MKNYIYKFYQRLFNVKRKYKETPDQILTKLLESQFWPGNKMREYQLEYINKLLISAKNHTKYYEKRANTEILPYKSLKKFLESFPRISKELIVNNVESLRNPREKKRFKHKTSGSTGTPMEIEISGMAESYRTASKLRFLSWWGVKINDRNVCIWGVKKGSKRSFWVKIKDWMGNRLLINVFDLSEFTIEKYFERVKNHDPIYIRGYKSAIYQFASLMESKNLKFVNSGLKVVIVTAEVLLENERAYMEKILGCKVANEYGSAEAGLYAVECPEGSMHINEESVFITSENNNAIVTELYNYGMPLINYINKDRCVISEELCNCGRTLRVIEEIQGRIGDYVECTDGSKKSYIALGYIFDELSNDEGTSCVKQYRITQKGFDFLVEINPNESFDTEVKDYLKSRMYEVIGDEINIEFKIVESIEREKSGKLRFFVRE